MVFALLIGLLATVWIGLELYAIEENGGLLAFLSNGATDTESQFPTKLGDQEEKREGGEHGS
jgi:hypothetical protein